MALPLPLIRLIFTILSPVIGWNYEQGLARRLIQWSRQRATSKRHERPELAMYRLAVPEVPQVAVKRLERAAATVDEGFHAAFEPLILVELDLAEQLQLVGAAPLDERDRGRHVINIRDAPAVRRGVDDRLDLNPIGPGCFSTLSSVSPNRRAKSPCSSCVRCSGYGMSRS